LQVSHHQRLVCGQVVYYPVTGRAETLFSQVTSDALVELHENLVQQALQFLHAANVFGQDISPPMHLGNQNIL
jgi:hypothetical protein